MWTELRARAAQSSASSTLGLRIPLLLLTLIGFGLRLRLLDSFPFREDEAIYLWLRLDDSLEPRYYVLPWQQQLAEKLQNLIDEAIRDGASVTISDPFSRNAFDNLGSLNARIIRPPTPPMKPPSPPPQFFNPRERRT